MNVVFGIFLLFSVFLALSVRGLLGAGIAVAGVAAVLLAIALKSFFRAEQRNAAFFQLFTSSRGAVVTDPRQVFARAARTAESGELFVSYIRYKQTYRATIVTALIFALLVVVAALRFFQDG